MSIRVSKIKFPLTDVTLIRRQECKESMPVKGSKLPVDMQIENNIEVQYNSSQFHPAIFSYI